MMATPQAANLSNCGNELLRCIEELKRKRDEITKSIIMESEEKDKIQRGISQLSDRLQKINGTLDKHCQAKEQYDKTIQDTEAAYMKIIESSQTLLHVLKREAMSLAKRNGES